MMPTHTVGSVEALPLAMVDSLQKVITDFQVRAECLSGAYASMQRDFRKVNLELDRKNAELQKSLEEQDHMRTYLDSILESMENGVIGIDTAARVTRFNRAATAITGYSADEVLGRKYEELFRQHGENEEPSLLSILRTRKEMARNEKVFWNREGQPVPVSYRTSPLHDRHGDCIGAVEIFTDVSRIKALENEMQHARTMAALGEMSATVAHEIRNPLGAMGMWAGLLERDLPADDTRSVTLKKIIEGLSRLNKIVSNLLVYTRPVKAKFRKMTIETVLAEVADFVEIEVERLGRPITVKKEWDADAPTFVLADPEKMEQVTMNLCLNAIQAMPQGGILTIGTEKPSAAARGGTYACFVVRDTGEGIRRHDLQKIFDPFFTTRENGTGLGLAIVKKFVEFHGGHIDVQSRIGDGAAFRVFLPKLKE